MGYTGEKGSAGDIGYTGRPGPEGDAGAPGEYGVGKGLPGPRGVQGVYKGNTSHFRTCKRKVERF